LTACEVESASILVIYKKQDNITNTIKQDNDYVCIIAKFKEPFLIKMEMKNVL
jgi:hypothetical protein